MAAKGTIYGINGPIVYIAGDSGFQMNEMVYVGEANLVGEVSPNAQRSRSMRRPQV